MVLKGTIRVLSKVFLHLFFCGALVHAAVRKVRHDGETWFVGALVFFEKIAEKFVKQMDGFWVLVVHTRLHKCLIGERTHEFSSLLS